MKKKVFKIGRHTIKEGGRVFIIAEAGVNHNGRLDLALKLVDLAADIGADAVKFQTFRAENVVSPQGKMASYQIKNIGRKMTQLEMAESLVLPYDYHLPIIKRCYKRGILFLSTPHGGRESADFLYSLKVPAFKIGSGDLTNYILLEHVAKFKKPMIVSTGMATMEEVERAVEFIKINRNNKIIIMHCTTNYPCLPNQVNLLAMKTMMEKLDVPVGYSDHTQGNQVAIMAATLGMAAYEFHITLDKKLPGPDHIASADPKEAEERVKVIRKTHIILGKSVKKPNFVELPYAKQVRRHLVAAKNLKKGQTITKFDLEALRPEDGVSPIYYYRFLGKKLKKDLKRGQKLSFSFIDK